MYRIKLMGEFYCPKLDQTLCLVCEYSGHVPSIKETINLYDVLVDVHSVTHIIPARSHDAVRYLVTFTKSSVEPETFHRLNDLLKNFAENDSTIPAGRPRRI